jgi:hypothetical protein
MHRHARLSALLLPALVAWSLAWCADLAAEDPATASAPATAPVPASSAAPAHGAFHATHVVILTIDGPRWSETWGEPTRQYIPHRAKDLAPQGILLTHFENAGETLTTPGHTAITTGFYQTIDNQGQQLPDHPGLFQRWLRAHPDAPNTDAWLIASKDKLAVLADCTDPEWHGKFMPATDCGKAGLGSGMRDDSVTLAHAESRLAADHPHLALVHFRQPDSAGHAHDWDAYLQGIRDTDADAGELWRFLQADPGFAGTTDLFITNDHGRHPDGTADGFVSHGDGCPGCRHIELLALGPDLTPGATSDQPRNQTDLTATIAAILGLDLPGSGGQVMREILKPAP